MATALLTTKLFVPPVRPFRVPRSRLTQQLRAGAASKLTLLVAPAGFGKTTLLSDFVAGHAVAWVSLDASDNDATRFWSYVLAALDRLHPGVAAAALAVLQSPQPPPIETILTTLLNALSVSDSLSVLVLDDYHLIDAVPVHQALAWLLEHLPPQLHLVIASRTDLPLPVSRLRARGELTELRSADLRFTPDEAAAFLTTVMGLPLTAQAVAALETRTEGWIAGLQFAALALRDRSDVDGFIAAFTGSNRFVVDYLAEEVLGHLPPEQQSFLLNTSLLDRLCAPLCDALLRDEHTVARSTGSQALLAQVERANLFMVPLDDTRHWYRFHHLFVDVLRARLRSSTTPEALARLHRRASAWFEAQGLVAEAVQHALAANDGEHAARLVEHHGDTVWMHGGLATLLSWLTALPEAAFASRPKLALTHAFLLMILDDFALSERRLAAAEQALQAAQEPDRVLLGQAAVIRAGIALMVDSPGAVTIAAGHQALDLLPTDSHTWRGTAANFLGCGYYAQAGDIDAGERALREAEQVSLRGGDALMASLSTTHLSILLEIGGRLHASEQLNRDNLDHAAKPFWQGVPLAGYAGFGLSRVLIERNELHAARDHLTDAVAQLELWALKRPMIHAYVHLARVYQALDEPEHARRWIQRAVAIVRKDKLTQTFSHWAAYKAQMDVAYGDQSAVTQWVREIEPSTGGALSPALEFEHITLAQIYVAQHRLDDAHHLLARLRPAAEAAGRRGRALAIMLLEALTTHARGQPAVALATLDRALALAEPEGYVRSFVGLGSPMEALLAQHVASNGAHDSRNAYATRLLAAFRPQRVAGTPTREANEPAALVLAHAAGMVEPLSVRELEILRLIADGHSNQAIAATLVVAVSTVKKHINNLYGKLAVQSRTQALVRARELDLLG